MEYQFEILGRDSLQMHRDVYSIVFKPYVKIFTIAFLVCAACYALLGWAEQDGPRIMTACLCCLYALLAGQIPRMAAKHSWKERMKYYGGETPESTARFGESLVVEDVDSSRSIPYEKITKIHYIQDAIVIFLGKQQAVAVPYQTFVKGSLPELKAFLRKKCPNTKISE